MFHDMREHFAFVKNAGLGRPCTNRERENPRILAAYLS